jgi:hypothetical protein
MGLPDLRRDFAAGFITNQPHITRFYGLPGGISISAGHNWVNRCRFRASLPASYGIDRLPPASGGLKQ